MSTQVFSQKEAAARFYEPFNRRDLSLLPRALHPDWAIHPVIPGEGPDFGKYLPRAAAILEAFPDLHMQVEAQVAEGDLVAVRITISGTQTGSWLGVPATGKRISIAAHDFHRVQRDQIVESWHVEDWLSGLVQMGAFPPG